MFCLRAIFILNGKDGEVLLSKRFNTVEKRFFILPVVDVLVSVRTNDVTIFCDSLSSSMC